MIIENGVGNANKAEVNKRFELQVNSRMETHMHKLSESEGRAHWITTGGFVPLLLATGESAVLQVINTSDKNMHIYWMRSCGEAGQKWRLVRQSTGGTIDSGGTVVVARNLNSNSTHVMSAEVKVGVDGSTVIGGDHLTQWINAVGHSNSNLEGALLLAPNHRLVWMCTPIADGDVCLSMLATEGD